LPVYTFISQQLLTVQVRKRLTAPWPQNSHGFSSVYTTIHIL